MQMPGTRRVCTNETCLYLFFFRNDWHWIAVAVFLKLKMCVHNFTLINDGIPYIPLFRVYVLDSLSQSITTASKLAVKNIQLFLCIVCEEVVELTSEAAKVNLHVK